MTTGELIAELKLDPSGQGHVKIPVKTYTSVYPHAYLAPFSVSATPHYSDSDKGVGVRIYVSFPKGFRVSKLKL